ncbi:MAG: WYL domain-containing transcriptional regulator [Planctomycetia bacterium]|nr:WYL domain-containing transcriptional regulator [Planctomycetia bacterium]
MMTLQETKFTIQWKRIEQLSQLSTGMTVKELMKEWKCSERTVRRQLEVFENCGILNKTVENRQTFYRIMLPWRESMFTFDEIMAMYIGRRFLEPLKGTFLWEAIQKALGKMQQNLSQASIQFFESSPVLVLAAYGKGRYEDSVKIINELNSAIADHRQVEILHKKFQAVRASKTRLNPYGMAYHEGSLYLIGHSYKRKALRQWKVERISRVTILEKSFCFPKNFNLTEHISGGFGMLGIYKEDENFPVKHVKIRFREYFARIVAEKHWHASQKITHEPDGSVILEMDLSELRILKYWVMGFGQYAEVLEPKEFREMVQTELTLTAQQYL